jgi:hypothetical protein
MIRHKTLEMLITNDVHLMNRDAVPNLYHVLKLHRRGVRVRRVIGVTKEIEH